MSNFVKIVRKIVKSSIHMIDDFFINARADVINFNRFIVSVISIHDHLNFNLSTLFFSFEIFSTTDERFKIKMLRRLSRWYRDVRVWNIVTLTFSRRNRTKWTSSTLKWDYLVNCFQLINFLLQLFVDLSNLFKFVLRAH